jgi:preprotein translocase subunit SecA
MDDVVYRTKREKYNAIIDEVGAVHEKGLPILVGTISVETSETLSRMLKRRGIHHSVLNAKYHKQEAEIVSMAGEPGMVTIATNMAGRGTDIKLGAGVIRFPDELIDQLIKDLEHGPSRHKETFIHELPPAEVRRVGEALRKKNITHRIVASVSEKNALLERAHDSKDEIMIVPRDISSPNDTRNSRTHCDHIKARDYSEGGLHIIGTERHEARRIDRQLRGRSGRQGDPGSTRFYLCLEDELMRLFGSERIGRVMDRLGVEEGEVITHPMITRSIERAQKRVEMRNFDIRKHLLEYDDVMNKQREVIYTRRGRALVGENLREDIFEMIEDAVLDMVEQHSQGGEWTDTGIIALKEELFKTFLLTLPYKDEEIFGIKPAELGEKLIQKAGEMYEHKKAVLGAELMSQLERWAVLKTIDERWKEHLYEMDLLKEGIGLRAYGQKDPLLEYKQEGFRTFTEMLGRINQEVLEIVFKTQIQMESQPEVFEQRRQPVRMSLVHQEATGMGFTPGTETQAEGQGMPPAGKSQPIRVEKQTGRNEPCPCGSGKKYKHCHGKE